MQKHYNGYSITNWIFINLENGQEVELRTSYAYEELNDMGIPCYPYHPNNIEEDQFIIWSRTTDSSSGKPIMVLDKVDYAWESIQQEYFNILQKTTREDAVKKIMQKYCISSNDA